MASSIYHVLNTICDLFFSPILKYTVTYENVKIIDEFVQITMYWMGTSRFGILVLVHMFGMLVVLGTVGS
jgi:hypothetical protein